MTEDAIKDLIVEVIQTCQGMKATELPVKLYEHHEALFMEICSALQAWSLHKLAADLVKEGRIIEIEYILPDMTNRIKSFYLPKGTQVKHV